MNGWVLAKDLEEIAAASEDANLRKLCGLVHDNYRYPVDTVLLSPDLRVIGHKNVNDAMHEGASGYRQLLRRALGEAVDEEADEAPEQAPDHATHGLGGNPRRALKLTPEDASGSLLDVLAAGDPIAPPDQLFSIDLTGFANGGRLEIEVRVGASDAAGRFQLLELHRTDQGRALVSVDEVAELAPGAGGRLGHRFPEGRVLYLSATRHAGSPQDSTNAFEATVVVQEE